MPNKTLSKFEKDLDVIPMYFAEEKDLVLVHQLPDQRFLDLISRAGFSIPNFRLADSALVDSAFTSSPKESLHPWGWSPRMHHILRHCKSSCTPDFLQQPNAFWQPEHRDLYSRKTALEVLTQVLNKTQNDGFMDSEQRPQLCTSVAEIEELLKKWRQIVIKAPWSSSGRGLQVLRQSCLNESIIQWINGTLASQSYLMVEPLLNKTADFSLQFYSDGKGKVTYLGSGFFETNSNGQYLGNYLGEGPKSLNKELLSEMIELLSNAIENSEIATCYAGYLGVDCMLFTDRMEKLRVQPCLEINLRYTMGTLALFLNRMIWPGSRGIYKVHYNPKSTFDEFHTEMEKKYPFEMKNGKWMKGYLPLVSPFQHKSFGAYILLE